MRRSNNLFFLIIPMMVFGFFSCRTIPQGATAVEPFYVEKYLGKWYEIARLDFKYERNLNNVTAEYSWNENGSIRVVNRGYNTVEKEWQEAVGKAKFVGEKDVAKLKVSFFGPFYSGYNVIAIDENYQFALVAGKNLDYLWILCRKTTVPDDVKEKYLKIADDIGYNTSDLLWPQHD
ncbi:lipocalin family protein [Marinilabilia salmonicolor]|uniref:lipocalin family protein n=1 Tax=Marinilabilia salmonicolor TaxID=989 RepID=UPI00029B2714|nr:lipocalin family protein [Marinilabilia salmonicolor]